MLKTSICVMIVAGLSLGGCATVSVIPGAAPAEQVVSLQQSSLRTAASNFSEQAIERGWIKRERGFMQFARTLAHGNDSLADDGTAGNSYSGMIGVTERNPDSVVKSLASDVNDASSLLAALSQEAQAFLATEQTARNVTARGDLVSFERTLVQAQTARRTFADVLAQLDTADTAAADAAMTKFDRQIARARLIADRLAREYATRNVGAVS